MYLGRRAALRQGGRLAAAAALGALAAGLAGCGLANAPRGARAAAPLTLLVDADVLPAAEALGTAYAGSAGGAMPLIQVAEPSLAQDVDDMLAGDPSLAPDVLWVSPAVRDSLLASTLMVNLAPALADTGIASGLYASCLRYCASGPRQLAIPTFRDPLVVYYNSDALAKAGLNPPAAGWTVHDLVQACEQILQRLPRPAAPLANALNIFDLELFCAFVVGYGGVLLQPAQVGYTPQFASSAGAQGAGALAALHAYEPAEPPASPQTLFAQGHAVFYFGHRSDLGPLSSAIAGHFAWNIVALPRFPARAAQPVAADGLAVVTGDPGRRAAAIAMALFAGSPPAQEAMAHAAVGVPALRALAASPDWRAAAPNVNLGVFTASPGSDLVVQRPLYLIAPGLADAMRAVAQGMNAHEALAEAATWAEYQLATWQD